MLIRFLHNCGVYQAGMVLDMPDQDSSLWAGYVMKVFLEETSQPSQTSQTSSGGL